MSVRLLVLSDAGEGDLCMAARLKVGRAALLVEDGAVEASCERTTFGEKLVAVAAAGGLGRCSSVAADLEIRISLQKLGSHIISFLRT